MEINLTEKYDVIEYAEFDDVLFYTNQPVPIDYYGKDFIETDIISAYNEGGYASVRIDAYKLYKALKDIYEG